MKTYVRFFTGFLLAATGFFATHAAAAPLGIGYSLGGGLAGAVREDFDSMGSGNTAPGAGGELYWSINVSNNERATNLFLANAFPSNGGYNGGPWPGSGLTPDTDRALGVYAGNTTDNPRYLLTMITNNTGADLSSFFLRFDVEAWIKRNSAADRFGGIQATFSLNGSTFTDLGNAFEGIKLYPELGSSTNNYWIDGNDPTNCIRNIGGQVSGVSIPAGAVFYLRFEAFGNALLTDPDGAGPMVNRQVGVFLDNLYVGVVDRDAVVTGPTIEVSSLRATNGTFSLTIPTAGDKFYTLQYVENLGGTNWISLPPMAGTGGTMQLEDPAATVARRFYRVKVD